MLAAVLHAPRDLRLEQVPRPVPGAGEIVVRVEAALMCGTDIKTWRRGHRILPLPAVVGREPRGRSKRSAKASRKLFVGDRVVPAVSGPCNECDSCAAGRANLCRTAMDVGAKMWGAFAEAVLVPARVVRTNVHRVPDGIPVAEAALLDPLASVVQAWRRLPDPWERSVAVLGAGPMGLLHAMVARSHGAKRVVVIGRRSMRLALAKELGADSTILSSGGHDSPREAAEASLRESGDDGFDVVVDCGGTPESWEEATWLARPGGTVSLFSGCAPGLRASFDTARLHYDEIALVGSFHYDPTAVRKAFDLIVSRRMPLGRLLSERFPLDRVSEVFDRHARGEGLKEVIVP